MRSAAGPRWGAHHDLPDAGGSRGYGAHHDRGGIRRSPARHVDRRALYRPLHELHRVALGELHSHGLIAHLRLRDRSHVRDRRAEAGQHGGLEDPDRRLELVGVDPKLARARLRMVEALCEIEDSLVAALADRVR